MSAEDRDFGITPELIGLLKREEGWVDHPYLCPAGYPTIGYGHRIPSMDHPPITKAEGLELLMADVRFKRDAVLKISPGLIDESERRVAAVIDFCYNLGEGAYKGSTLRKKVDAKLWREAAGQMMLWVNARDPKTKQLRRLEGLVRRRTTTAKWLLEG